MLSNPLTAFPFSNVQFYHQEMVVSLVAQRVKCLPDHVTDHPLISWLSGTDYLSDHTLIT